MTHKPSLFGQGSKENPAEQAGRHGGSVKHRSRKRRFKLREQIPWYFIIGVLVGLGAAWLVSILFVNNFA